MSYTLKLVDWRDHQGMSHPEYQNRPLWQYVDGPLQYPTRKEAEEAAEHAWVEPDCNGVAPCVSSPSADPGTSGEISRAIRRIAREPAGFHCIRGSAGIGTGDLGVLRSVLQISFLAAT
jgi:hypothetical protein